MKGLREKDSGLILRLYTYIASTYYILYKPFPLVRGCTHSFIHSVITQIVIMDHLAFNCFTFSKKKNNFHADVA